MSHRHRSLIAAPVAAVLVALSVIGLAPAPASAAPVPFTLTLVPGQGQVVLGDNPEPLLIGSPTVASGQIDDVTGAISGVSFSTPDIPFEQESGGLHVDIVATFTELSPGANTGQADGLGNVRLDVGVRLDLHINVAGGAIITDCVSSPIEFQLVSTAPYDPVTQRVTLVDPQVTIPPVVASDQCNSLVVEPINSQLAGDDNSMTFVMEGPLALPPPPGDPSTTTLTSDVDTTPMGQPVTFTAAVEPAEATGTVTFRNGPVPLGQAPVAGGAATLTTTALPVGTHQVTAEYSGDTDYDRSASAPLTHTVTAVPTITANFPTHIVAGADPVEITATITNPSAGGPLPNLRVDWRFGRVGNNMSGVAFGNARFTLEYRDGTDWVPIALDRRTTPPPADDTGTLAGSYGGPTGFSLPAGQQRTVTFRVAATDDVAKGLMPVQVRLNTVDADTGAVLTTLSEQTIGSALVPPTRLPTTLAITTHPTLTRPGYYIQLGVSVTTASSLPLTGDVALFIDGQQAPLYIGGASEPSLTMPAGSFSPISFDLLGRETWDLTPGPHTFMVRYLGDVINLPAESEAVTIEFLPSPGQLYDCGLNLVIFELPLRGRPFLSADLPVAAPSGTTVTPGRLSILTIGDGTSFPIAGAGAVFGDDEAVTSVTFTNGGTGTFNGLSGVVHANGIDQTISWEGITVELPIEGQPGDVIDFGFLGISVAVPFSGATATLGCTVPEGAEPVLLGSIVVSGTTLDGPSGPVEAGSPVALTATVHPASAEGVVEFVAGTTSLGFAPVAGGRATLAVSDLPLGTHQVEARYLGDLTNPPSTSDPAAVTVRDVVLCPDQAVAGNGAVVRSVYLHLLGRCGDPAGFAYWTGRLDGGLAAEAFARQIAGSLEAHGRSVDDAYHLVLGRAAEPDGRDYWARRLQGGHRYDRLVGDLAASAEFWTAAGGTNAGWVTRVYERLLDRPPTAGDLTYWTGRLAAGQSRAAVAATLVRLTEPTGALVAAAHRAILHRDPTAEELAAGVAGFRADGHRARIYASLVGTEEFFSAAQGHPNP